ncbi:type II secretion system GspH family protein [Candidatus Parcubacteria bacterium]|nr:type II secretion system GspH family protein [Patescibacteria group bacterium]MBU4309066.1 type II secretion system GspH family protein [Patescibacteria group bacterium]MBU4432443.1 type II secretion system GspH family protein [Patescibacteria group bacterium]MBU4577427.1 type II secretion system GspH family protein [Patescibacteria group bacterium]MCG2697115.1 type II secretion system GspH family protein [Candidatus Parcubacteria bacterium]
MLNKILKKPLFFYMAGHSFSSTMKNKTGFTMIELIVVIAVMGVISTMVLNFTVMGLRASRFEAEQAEAVKQARDAMNIMKTEIRGANNSAHGDYPISVITNQEFAFFSDIDKDDVYEKVRYYLDGLELKKAVIEPNISNLYTDPPVITVIANYVNNQTENVFNYYTSNYTIAGDINEVRLINMNLKINVTPEISPADIYVETDVALRNLKSNL